MTDYIKREDAQSITTKLLSGYITDESRDYLEKIEVELAELPSADVVEKENANDEWCIDCKEYDTERHCCPRWNKVIRDTMDEIRQNAEENWDKVEVVRCKDCKHKPNGYTDDDVLRYPNFPHKENNPCPCQVYEDEWYSWIPNGDFYCSYGERDNYDSD